jgi:cyclopropane fatty-acyl-phospholipid synthase-like methyltransferase
MYTDYFIIRDNCRQGLLKYLSKAISVLPKIENPLILDVGCGSGVSTLFLTEYFDGKIIAIDQDNNSIRRLCEKVDDNNLSTRITIIEDSVYNINSQDYKFDLILAEGILKIIGFEKGFLKLKELSKPYSYLIIHDDYHNQNMKKKFVENNNCRVLDIFRLNESVWWNNYYHCLEKEISSLNDKALSKLFSSDLNEIKLYKQDSSQFKSDYYIIESLN